MVNSAVVPAGNGDSFQPFSSSDTVGHFESEPSTFLNVIPDTTGSETMVPSAALAPALAALNIRDTLPPFTRRGCVVNVAGVVDSMSSCAPMFPGGVATLRTRPAAAPAPPTNRSTGAPPFVRFQEQVSVTVAPGGCRQPTRSVRVCGARDPLRLC